eukprot:1580856-Rhodomonas_salina.1
MTPYEAFNGRQPDNSKLRIFGCFVWVWVARGSRSDQKWADTSIPAVFLGFVFHLGQKGYLLGSLDSRRFFVSTNCTWDESRYLFRHRRDRHAMAQRVWGDNPAGLEPIVIDLNKGLDTLMEGVVGPPVLLVDGDVVTVRGQEDGPVMLLPDADKRRVLRRTFKGPVIDYGVDEDQIPADPRVKRLSQSGRRRRAPATTGTAADHTLHNTTETSEEAG